jgi:2-haloacid dehalogenase
MTPLKLTDFDAITFDVYGTLIDWEPAITAFLADWAARNAVPVAPDELLNAYDRARAVIQLDHPTDLYPDILRRSFDHICATFDRAPDSASREAFATSPATWPAYPDSHAGLVALQRSAKIVAFSNIDDASLAASSGILGVTFDLTVTAERVRSYKPGLAHFHTGLAELAALGIPLGRVLHVAQSLRADIAPANQLGLTCVWVDRPGRVLGLLGPGTAEARADLTVSTLAELVGVLT